MPLAARSTCDLGLVGYDEAFAIQSAHAERRAAGEIGDTLLLCEHPSIYTLGTNATKADVLDRTRAPVVQSDRGGEATYHGPGQVVGYVIADLEPRGRDLHAFCRDLEEIMLRVLAGFGLKGRRIDGLTGVWLGPDKVGALGVRVRRWISTHGFALNVGCDLSYFGGIIPCGLSDRGVTSIEQALSRSVDLGSVKESCGRAFEDIFQA
ncbi:MAG: lipoyl(octanoyl) transferase LipB [Planctomycetota bacterium]|jgi:lipoate-protein ligase B